MTHNSRVIIRLIALWLVFIASVGVIFWAGQHFAVNVVKLSNGYQETACVGGYCPLMQTLSSCIMPPPYPGTGAPMMGGIEMGMPDSTAMNKYNQDYQKYTEAYAQACKEDVMRQQGMQKNSSAIDIAGYSVLLLLAGLSAVMSIFAIKQAEQTA